MNSDETSIRGAAFGPSALPGVLPVEMLVTAMEEAQVNEARIRKRIDELQRFLARTQEELQILGKLIALRNGEISEDADIPIVHDPRSILEKAKKTTKTSQTALTAVNRILEEAGRPVHISELMRLLSEQDVAIPGSGTQANLISHLRRDRRIVRPSRGMYGLASWGLDEMPSQSKRRRKTRRRK